MSRTAAYTDRMPWENRWVEPQFETLLEPLNAQRRRLIEIIMETVNEYDGIMRDLQWYGPGWNWTLQYQFASPIKGLESDILCYLVPNPEAPIVCVPLCDAEIEKLPLKRLNKLIRTGINLAKCAVAIHWTTFTPTNQTEVGHIVDLIKRKHKNALEPAKGKKRK